MIHPTIEKVRASIAERSVKSRADYLKEMNQSFNTGINRASMSCGNLAHSFAACSMQDKMKLKDDITPNIGIISAYNDMLSAHKPYEQYPEMIRSWSNQYDCVAQFAAGVPAMCDGVTQGQKGMELSLYSRDVIAMSATIGLSHNVFDGVVYLGICDKIVPGLMMAALKFGYLPSIFLPGGPMASGISNDKKAKIRQDFAENKITREELLKGESDAYHSPGTCTFYGTANSNQMLMEMMGMQLPGSSFVNPGTKMRDAMNHAGIKTLCSNIRAKNILNTPSHIINDKSIVNGIIGLLATGGSTNLTIHLIAIAKAAGIIINWEDFSELSKVIPLITRVYPNGSADINHFHAAGGISFVMETLLESGLLYDSVQTVIGQGLSQYIKEAKMDGDLISYIDADHSVYNDKIVRKCDNPFAKTGGLSVISGNIGRGVSKISAVEEKHWIIEAPAIVFEEQEDLIEAFKKDILKDDFIAVLPFQGPQQNGMPELHKLTPILSILQRRGLKVGLITDGRMSGASGKIPSAIHIWPEASRGGNIAKIKDGDIIRLNCKTGELNVIDIDLDTRMISKKEKQMRGLGTELFDRISQQISSSEQGASFLV